MDTIYQQYDELIRSHPKEMYDAILLFESELEKKDCKLINKIIPSFLKPVFIQEEKESELALVLDNVINILEKVSSLYFSHPDLRQYFYLDAKGNDLIEIDPGYKRNIVICRPDSFISKDTLRFVEFNCDSPAGPGYTDVVEEIMSGSFPLQSLSDIYRWGSVHRQERLLAALLSAYKEFAGGNKRPNIAIVDWKEVKTVNEFRILQSYFKSQGYDTIIADPRDLKYIDGKLECRGFPIDLIYRRAIFRELLERYDAVQDFLTAYKKGKVCVVNPLRSRLASNKAILSIITNQKKYKQFFTDEENHIIKRHIPWTRRVIDMQTDWEDNLVFLKKHIIAHRDHLVLKPSDSYGGRDVVIGCETGQEEWENLLIRILGNNEDWVVQRYVDITQMDVPVIKEGNVELHSKKFNMNPFVFNGKYAGSMTRLSDQSVINVTAGGGMVPVMAYSPKSI